MTDYTKLTMKQKLDAVAYRNYQGSLWAPKAGDYYTTYRNDLELYRVADIKDGVVYTEYCSNPGLYSEWEEATFTTEGFGPKRLYVPIFILEQSES